MTKIEKEIFYKGVLYGKFGYSGIFPFSQTYKQLDKLCELIYKKRLHCIDDNTINQEELYKESQIKKLYYAERFLKGKNNIYNRLNKLDIVLYDDIIERITSLQFHQSNYILDVLENYDTESDDIITDFINIFGNKILNYEMVSILVDIYIQPLRYIENISGLLDNSVFQLNISDSEKTKICD
jgi:hypothetical protein